MRHDFEAGSIKVGFNFSKAELGSIFDLICQQGLAKEEPRRARFTFKQFNDAIFSNTEENWLVSSNERTYPAFS